MTNEELVAKLQKEYDPELMTQLWNQVEMFVRKIARRYFPALHCPSDQEDLIQEGYFGLVKAVERYDPNGQRSFVSFSAYFLHSAFSDFVGRQSGGSRGTSFRIRMLRKYESEYYELTGREPTDSQICHALGMSQEGLELIRRQGSSNLSINASGDDEDLTLLDHIPDPTVNVEEDVVDRIIQNQVHDLLVKYVNELPDLQRRIILMTYFGGRTDKEISSILMIDQKKLKSQKEIAIRRLKIYRHRTELGRFLPERLTSGAYRGSLERFRVTGSSSTEMTAIRNLKQEQKYTKSRLYTR